MRPDVRPVCMFCQTRFSLAPGVAPTRCESWRAEDGEHVERRTATPAQHARLRLDAPPVVDMKHPKQIEWEKTDAYKAAAGLPLVEPKKAEPPTGQPGLF